MEFLEALNYGNIMIICALMWGFNVWILSLFRHIGSRMEKIDIDLYKTNETVTRLDDNFSKFQEDLKSGSVKIAEKKKRKYVKKEKIQNIVNS